MNKILLRLWFVLITLATGSFAQVQYSEIEIKAAFLERFTRFIEWPTADVQANDSDSFVIGIVNGALIEEEISELYATQKIKNKPVKIIYISSQDSLTLIHSCHLIFIDKRWQKQASIIVKKIQGKAILTVGDGSDFFKKGVMINFYKDRNRLRFKINADSVRNAGLMMDFRLLKFASQN
ncbi:MAG: YfiR family protein [Candidatus Neomarinimicrobiota bacterium]